MISLKKNTEHNSSDPYTVYTKGKRVERQLERLQEKIMKQQEIIGNLKIDSENLERLKASH